MGYTYILLCRDGSYYVGWTNNLENRLKSHNEGKGGRYTRGRRPVTLVYWEKHLSLSRSQAQKREIVLKNLSRKKKEDLIKSFFMKCTND